MRIERVESVDDERVGDYRHLTDVALRRRLEPERGLYMAEGAKVIARALAAGHRPRSVLLAERWLDGIREALGDADVTVFVAADEVLEAIAGYPVHRGALAAMERPALPAVADVTRSASRVVVVEGVVDHANVGAIFRAAAGLGVDAVLVTPDCADPLYRRSVKVSMGTVFQVPWTRIEPWPGGLDELRGAGFTVAGLALADDAVSLDEIAADPPRRLAWVLGAEGDGLSRRALAAADVTVTIPMAGGVDSLNVAAAASVAFWATRV